MPIRNLAQLRSVPVPPWIWEGFIAASNFTLLSAYPKVGKTTLLSRLIRSMMTEQPFLDRATRRVPILYISEEAPGVLAQRADALSYEDEWPISWLTPEPGLTWERCILYVKRWVYVHGNPLIVCDTLARFWSAGDENNATQVDHALRPILEIVRNSQAAFLGIHHNRKQGGGGGTAVRGSTALTGGVDVIMELARLHPYDHSNARRVVCESRFNETPSALQIRMVDGDYAVEDDDTVDAERQVIAILQTLEAIPISDLSVLSSIPETSLRRALNTLEGQGLVQKGGSGTRRSPFVYSLSVNRD